MTARVRITDVSPRDGLQNEPGVIPTADKVRLAQLLCAAGVDEVEVTGFVSPKWVPQLADGAAVCDGLASQGPSALAGVVLSALVPNEQGMAAAAEANRRAGFPLLGKVSVFTAASETFSKRNTNASIAESIARFRPVIERARAGGLAVRGYVSCAIACPFEGPIAPAQVARVAGELWDAGIVEIDLGDTIGAATAATTTAMLTAVHDELRRRPGAPGDPREAMVLHLHDTFGRASECARAALDFGIRSFDGSVAGLGGCPYASTPTGRAPGNISTETLVRVVHGAGYRTGVDERKLAEAGRFAQDIVGRARAQAAASAGGGS